MRVFVLAVLMAASATPALAAPPRPVLVAEPAATTPSVKPSQAEALALAHAYAPSHLRRKAELTILEKNFVPGLRGSPEMAAMLDAFPNLGPELKKAMAGQIDIYMAEYDERFFPRAAAILRESLSKDDVLALTAFYTSPTGQRALTLTTEKVDGSEIMELAVKNEAIDTKTAARQAIRAGLLTYKDLGETDREKIRELSVSPAGRNFLAIMPKLAALQTELMNNPGPRFKASTEKVMTEAIGRVTGVDPGVSK